MVKLNDKGQIHPRDLASLVESMNAMYDHLNSFPLEKKCWDCNHYVIEAGYCNKYSTKPPQEVKQGDIDCPGYEFNPDSPPF